MVDTQSIDPMRTLEAETSRLGCEVARLNGLVGGLSNTINCLVAERDRAVFRCGQAEARVRTAEEELHGVMVSVLKWFDGDYDPRLKGMNPTSVSVMAREIALQAIEKQVDFPGLLRGFMAYTDRLVRNGKSSSWSGLEVRAVESFCEWARKHMQGVSQ